MIAGKPYLGQAIVTFNNNDASGSLIGAVSIDAGATPKSGTYRLRAISVNDDINDNWKLIVTPVDGGNSKERMVVGGTTYKNAFNNSIIEGLAITLDTPENEASATITVQDVLMPQFILSDGNLMSLPVANAMKTVQIKSSAVAVTDAGELITFDCRGYSAFSIFIQPVSGTAPSTVEIHGGIQNNIKNNTTFAKCITPAGGNGPSAVIIGSLTPASGAARCGPRLSVSHPYHALYLAGGTTYKADIWVVLHSNGSMGCG